MVVDATGGEGVRSVVLGTTGWANSLSGVVAIEIFLPQNVCIIIVIN